ncbi:MAG TPA: nuclear transport factor 2 family protein [Candidatus Binatia bacterium]
MPVTPSVRNAKLDCIPPLKDKRHTLTELSFAPEEFVMSNERAVDSEWTVFIAKLEAAETEFAQGRPAAFKELWSHADDVTLCGGFGGRVKCGWESVAARLDWASSKYSDGTRSSESISGTVGPDFAYRVQTELIRFRVAGRTDELTQQFRVTMVFRREADGWRIVHRHADSQISSKPP